MTSRNMSYSAGGLSLRLSRTTSGTQVQSFKTLKGAIAATPRDARQPADEPSLSSVHGDASESGSVVVIGFLVMTGHLSRRVFFAMPDEPGGGSAGARTRSGPYSLLRLRSDDLRGIT